MNDLGQIRQKIECVRGSLNALVAQKNTTDPEVAKLSIRLDELIVSYERQKAKLKQRGK